MSPSWISYLRHGTAGRTPDEIDTTGLYLYAPYDTAGDPLYGAAGSFHVRPFPMHTPAGISVEGWRFKGDDVPLSPENDPLIPGVRDGAARHQASHTIFRQGPNSLRLATSSPVQTHSVFIRPIPTPGPVLASIDGVSYTRVASDRVGSTVQGTNLSTDVNWEIQLGASSPATYSRIRIRAVAWGVDTTAALPATNDGQWMHLLWSMNAAGRVRLWVNNTELIDQTGTAPGAIQSGMLQLGGGPIPGNSWAFPADLDEWAIWTRELTEVERGELYSLLVTD